MVLETAGYHNVIGIHVSNRFLVYIHNKCLETHQTFKVVGWNFLQLAPSTMLHFKGELHPKLKLSFFVLYLKVINSFFFFF